MSLCWENIYRIALDYTPVSIFIQNGINRLKRLHNRTVGIKASGFDLESNLFITGKYSFE